MQDQIQEDLKQAQLGRDEVKVSTLRLLLSEIKNTEIAKGDELSDADIVATIQKEVKKRKEAAEGFRKGNREDQASAEEAELKILEAYLPAQLSNEELTEIVDQAITEIGATQISDMGRVISLVMSKAAGKVDGGRVSSLVKEKLSNG